MRNTEDWAPGAEPRWWAGAACHDPRMENFQDRSPMLRMPAFHCPSCGVYAAQTWGGMTQHRGQIVPVPDFSAAMCEACQAYSLWSGGRMIYPLQRQGESPHGDMPEDVLAIYNEAREVAPISRKSAAGLLRLALQMLVDELEPGRGTIDNKIGALVQKGLDPQVQKMMDVLRVVGNESVHPGQIDLEADGDFLPALFNVLNIIVEQIIARPKHIDELYAMLPEGKRDAIDRRDGVTPVAEVLDPVPEAGPDGSATMSI